MSRYNVCYWYDSKDEAWNSIGIDDEVIRGDNIVTIVDKTDTHVTIEYHSGKRIRLTKEQALNSLYR
jgi:hypothetical protein